MRGVCQAPVGPRPDRGLRGNSPRAYLCSQRIDRRGNRKSSKSKALPGFAMEQSGVRMLQSWRRPPRSGIHNGSPKAAMAPRCMPDPRTRAKLPKVRERIESLLTLGHRVSDSGPQTSKSLNLQRDKHTVTAARTPRFMPRQKGSNRCLESETTTEAFKKTMAFTSGQHWSAFETKGV
jgi:hypothetical protein